MKTKLFTIAAIAVLLSNIAVFASGDAAQAAAKRRQVARLISMLPPSDGVATLDSKRLFSDAVPQVLSANQPMLTAIMAQIDNIEARTGIDLRKFDAVAVGLSLKKVTEKECDFDPVAIAQGDLKAGALVAIAKLASNGTYREEKVGDRTVYVFAAKAVLQKTVIKPTGSKIEETISKALDGLTHEVAVTALDPNTLAFGSLARVRETIEGKAHVSPEVTGALGQKETSVINFAMRTPTGMSKLLPLDNDEIGANIDSIRFVAGSIDVAAAGTSLQLTARTAKAEQAQGLFDTLDGLKMIGKAFLGGSKRADQKVYARLIENAKVAIRGTSVTLDLTVPQSDIDALIGAVK